MQKRKNTYERTVERFMSSNHKYLKYWNHDYLYLNNVHKKDGSLFPVPEKSNSQKHLRDFHELMARISHCAS